MSENNGEMLEVFDGGEQTGKENKDKKDGNNEKEYKVRVSLDIKSRWSAVACITITLCITISTGKFLFFEDEPVQITVQGNNCFEASERGVFNNPRDLNHDTELFISAVWRLAQTIDQNGGYQKWSKQSGNSSIWDGLFYGVPAKVLNLFGKLLDMGNETISGKAQILKDVLTKILIRLGERGIDWFFQWLEGATLADDQAQLCEIVRFNFGEAVLAPSGLKQVDNLVKSLKGGPVEIMMLGYADEVGSQQMNQELAMKRIDSIHRRLIRNSSIQKTLRVPIGESDSPVSVVRSTREEMDPERRCVYMLIKNYGHGVETGDGD